jgi:hypothetical protein
MSSPSVLPFVEGLDDLVTVLAKQIERHVVGPGNMGGLELARRPHIQNPRRNRGSESVTEVLRIEGGGSGHGDQRPSGCAGGALSL